MQKIFLFSKKVNKIAYEQIRQKDKEVLQDLQNKKGIDNQNNSEADQYLSEKFMNFFTARKISYLKQIKEQGIEENEKDFQNSIRSQLIVVYQNNGKVFFSLITFKSISEQLQLKQKTIQEQNEYIKKNLDKVNVEKRIEIKQKQFKLIQFNKFQQYNDFKKIVEQLKLPVY